MHGYEVPRTCRIKNGFSGQGSEGVCYGYFHLDDVWAIVQWKRDTVPSVIKTDVLELQEITWVDAK